jgi:hypothetical protein
LSAIIAGGHSAGDLLLSRESNAEYIARTSKSPIGGLERAKRAMVNEHGDDTPRFGPERGRQPAP